MKPELKQLLTTNNPKWPPIIGDKLMIESYLFPQIFLGIVESFIWNNTAAIIKLENHTDFYDHNITKQNIETLRGGRGYFILLGNYGWRKLNDVQFSEFLAYNGKIEDIPDNLDKMLKEHHIYTQHDIQNAPYSKKNIQPCTSKISEEVKHDIVQDPQKSFFENLFQDDKLDKQKNIQEQQTTKTIEQEQEQIIFQQTPVEIMKKLQEILNQHSDIQDLDRRIVINRTISIDHLIQDKEDEVSEGTKIVQWLIENIQQSSFDEEYFLFHDIRFSIFNGYVHIYRNGLPVNDIITRDLVGDLTYFHGQIGIPIDYHSLKYVLFQNDTQMTIQDNIDEQKDAEKILSQEYLIAIQPKPEYQMWALKRLIYAWYGDYSLQTNIRKIKILINQFRAINDKNFNNQYGVRPIIVIFPKYGKHSFKTVLHKLSNYFVLYQDIGWSCSTPTYFKKSNNLLWYTNGSIDLKLYFKQIEKDYDGLVKSKPFSPDLTKFNNHTDIIS
jgi:hypothetical protein